MKLIALIERPTRGQVFINNQNTAAVKPRGIPQFRQQHRRGVPGSQTAARSAGRRQRRAAAHHRRRAEARDRQARARGARSGRACLARRGACPLELSTGEQQRVGIARAIVAKPTLLIADEPTGNLDPDLALEIMKLFKRFNEVGVTVVIASHDVHLIERVRRAAHRARRRARRRRRCAAPGAAPHAGGRELMPAALKTWLARHAQTLMGSLGRIVQQPFATAMTMGVIAVALALPLFFNVLLQNTRTATGNWNQAFDFRSIWTRRRAPTRGRRSRKQLAPRAGCRRGPRHHRRPGARGVSRDLRIRQGTRCARRQSAARIPWS